MSLALSQANRLKADIRFAQAIKAFEVDLSKEQQTEFRKSTAPDVSDVMRLTAQFDRELLLKGHLRGYGPRLTNFLESVQKFASLGDILIGGSQYLPACGAWTLVRFALMSLVQFPKAVDKLSTLFMDIGRHASQHQNIRTLYPQSQHLQTCLVEYHIAVVQFCHKIYKFSQSSAIKQLMNNADDWVNKSKDELTKWARSVSDEVVIQNALVLQEETRKSSTFRTLWKNDNAWQTIDRTLQLRLNLADLCSTYDFRRTWKQIRKQGTTTVFSQEYAYQEWITNSLSCTLVYSGILGAGKSVALANMVDDLFLKCDKQDTTVAYFFCRRDDKKSLQPTTVIGSLARQILIGNAVPDERLVEFEVMLRLGKTSLDIQELCNLIKKSILVRRRQKLVFVLDGLQECSLASRDEILQTLRDLQSTVCLRFCLAVRHEPNVVVQLNQEDLHNASLISMPEIHPDMAEYIRSELLRLKDCRRLAVSGDEVLDEIRETLLRCAGGMFLWVVLQISALTHLPSDHAIRHSLRNLPRTLDGIYSQTLECHDTDQSLWKDAALSLVSGAIQPLTAIELKEALSVTPGDTRYDRTKLINDIYSLLALFKGLIIVDEEESTVHFVHQSVTDFIQTRKKKCISQVDAERYMIETILTYLNYSIFETRLTKIRGPSPDLSTIPSKIVASTLGSKLASLLPMGKSKVKMDLTQTMLENIHGGGPQIGVTPPFKSYADLHWSQHLLHIEMPPNTDVQRALWFVLLEQALSKRRLSMINDDSFDSFLCLVVAQGNLTLIRTFLNTDLFSSTDLAHALWTAAAMGQEEIVRVMLENNRSYASCRGPDGITTAMAAAAFGSVPILKMLLSRSIVDVKSLQEDRDPQSWTTLYHAAGNGRTEAVMFLLKIIHPQPQTQYHTQPSDSGFQQLTALMVAAKQGQTETVEILVKDERIDPNVSSIGEDETALEMAARNGHTLVVQALLRHPRLDLVSSRQGYEALSIAVCKCHPETVSVLLADSRIDPNKPQNKTWRSLLTLAIETSHSETVEALLTDTRIDPNEWQDQYQGTALTLAVRLGYIEIVKVLLASPRIYLCKPQNGPWRSSLTEAVRMGYPDIVKVLLADPRVVRDGVDCTGRMALGSCVDVECARLLLSDDQIDSNWTDDNGNNALVYVSNNDIVRLFLTDPRFNVHATNNIGLTALTKAVVEADLEKVKVCLESRRFRLATADKQGRTAYDLAKVQLQKENSSIYWNGNRASNLREIVQLFEKTDERFQYTDSAYTFL